MPWTYENYDVLPPDQKARLLRSYEESPFQDFDNDAIIYSAATVLLANNISNCHHIKVGSTFNGRYFDLSEQLTGKIDFTKQFTYFTLPTIEGKHSVAVVFDHKNKKCHLIDSLGVAYREAREQLTQVILTHTPDYRLVLPQNISQQNHSHNSGILTAANIVGIIVGDIDLETAQVNTPEMVGTTLGRLKLAYDEHLALVMHTLIENKPQDLETSTPSLKLAHHHRLAIRFQERFDSRVMLVALNSTLTNELIGIDERIQASIRELITCLQKEQDLEIKRGKVNCWNFEEFINKMPRNNPLVPMIVAFYFTNQPITMSNNDFTNRKNIKRGGGKLASNITHQMLFLNWCQKRVSFPFVPEPINQPSYNVMFKILMGVMVTGITLLLVACLIALNVFSFGTATVPTAIGAAAVGGGFSLTSGIGLFWNNRSNVKDKSENCPPSAHATGNTPV